MLLTPEYQVSQEAEENVIKVLLHQWLYDSHLWVQIQGLNMRQCKWCGAESTVTLQVTKGERFCPKNPIVDQIFKNVEKIIRQDLGQS